LNISFTEFRNEWYNEDGIKIIPSNLKLTPLICLLWYLGDGGLNQKYQKEETASLKLSTNCFSREDIEKILIPQLKNFEAWISNADKGQPIILIPRRKIEEFLKYIGKCPFKEYEYKWEVFPYKNKKIEVNGFESHIHLKDKFIKEYQNGITAYNIAKSNNVDINVVKYYLRKEGVFISERDKRKINWILRDPQGNLHETESLTKFAKENKLNHICLSRVANGKMEAHKGWICNYKKEI